MKSCIIIGGGVGGLFTGALLSVNGVKVTVLEKNPVIGGGLQCFRRDGKIFDTGMHIVGGMLPGGNIERICTYLGVYDNLKMKEFNPAGMCEIIFSKEGKKFIIPAGKENFINALSTYFPHEKEGVKKYVEAMYGIIEEMPLFSLKIGEDKILNHSENYLLPVDKFISKYVSDPLLCSLLAYLSPLYEGLKGHTPAYIHALLNVLFMDGTSSFIGGSQQLAESLKGVIEAHGGEVLTNKEIVEVNTSEKEIKKVKTASGEEFHADYFISSIFPSKLVKMVPKGSLGKSFERRINEIPLTCSAFSLFIDLEPDSMEFIEHPVYYFEEENNVWDNVNSENELWPSSLLCITPPDAEYQKYAERLIVICTMGFDEVKKWENSNVGKRSNDYYSWKKQCEDKILNKLEVLHPGIKNKIRKTYSASPLTIRDFYNAPEGSIYGFRKDSENIFLSQLFVNTKLKNLFLTGQNVNVHGICGVPLTAISTAEAILGPNYILNQLNNG